MFSNWQREISDRNRHSRDAWQRYSEHRQRVMQLLLAGTDRAGGRLCALGAGNSNDLDLRQLAEHYAEVHLVDLDAAALEQGWDRQGAPPGVKRHGGVELSGLPLAGDMDPAALANDDLARLGQAIAAGPRLDVPAAFDVVCSLGLVSQLLDHLVRWLPEPGPLRDQWALAMRSRHLQLLAELLAPAGRLVLVADFVSSDTLPELATIDAAGVPHLAAQALRQGNFFTGLNPLALQKALQDRAITGVPLADVFLHVPWRWWVSDRAYAVAAITARRLEP